MTEAAKGGGFSDRVVAMVPAWVSPNQITLLRMVFSILMLVLELRGFGLGLIILLGLAAGFSDLLDGAVARRRGQESALGAFLDPLSDKLFALVLVVLVWRHDLVPWWLLLCILITEVHTVAIPALAFQDRRRKGAPLWPAPRVVPNRWGKLKTGWLASALGLAVICHWAGFPAGVMFANANVVFGLVLGLMAEHRYFQDWRRGAYR